MAQAPWLPTKSELDDPNISEDEVWARVWTRMKKWYLKGCLEEVSSGIDEGKKSAALAGREEAVHKLLEKLERAITKSPEKVFCVTFLMAFVPVEEKEEEEPVVQSHEKFRLATQESNKKLLKKLKTIQGVKDVVITRDVKVEWEEEYKLLPANIVDFDKKTGDLVRSRESGSEGGKGRPSSASHSKRISMMVELLIGSGVKSKAEAFRIVASALYLHGFTKTLSVSSIERTYYQAKKEAVENGA